VVAAAVAASMWAGPVEFGMAELQRAIAARGLSPKRFIYKTEVTGDPGDSYRITPGLIAGGDLRGLMYGLLDAAAQIRATGRVRKSQGTPALAIRGMRLEVEGDPEWLYSREDWPALFRSLARNRFNRFKLAVADLGGRKLEMLKFISQTASDYGVDFAIGLAFPASYAVVSELLSACPAIRAVQVGGEADAVMEVIRALRDAGRRVTLEASGTLPGTAAGAGVPVRLSASYPGDAPFGRQFLWEIEKNPHSSISNLAAKLAGTGAGGFEIEMSPADRAAAIAMDREGRAAATLFLLGRFAYDPKGNEL
jgi:hypothetical protein